MVSGRSIVQLAKELQRLHNKLLLVKDHLHRDRLHYGIFPSQACQDRIIAADAEQARIQGEMAALLTELRAALDDLDS